MLPKGIEINGEKCVIFCLVPDEGEGLVFFCHNEASGQSHSEDLPEGEFLQRLKKLNARVKFPTEAVRQALLSAEPSQASLDEITAEGVHILDLKYSLTNAPVSLKWEWHLRGIRSDLFYRKIFVHSIGTLSVMRNELFVLMEHLKAKDRELEQYRTEGFQLRRATVVTKVFDENAFKMKHQLLLAESAAFHNIQDIFRSPMSDDFGSPISSGFKTPSSMSSWSSVSSPSTTKSSPRNRKRKALESNIQHMERKVKSRQDSSPYGVHYKNSESSQEDNLDDWFQENQPIEMPTTSATIKQEAATNAAANILKDEEPVLPKVLVEWINKKHSQTIQMKTEKAEEQPSLAYRPNPPDADDEDLEEINVLPDPDPVEDLCLRGDRLLTELEHLKQILSETAAKMDELTK
ncbi:hypothetical protein KR009_000568 [Drosophila setifemur]|nr:hypothetical protein KR009_000568 [Drosophila setifemur]